MKGRGSAVLVLVAVTIISGCDEDSNTKQSRSQETILAQATNAVGMPAIPNFQERRMMKEIYELRDQAIATTTYIVDLYGKLHKVCDSIGYGLPYSTQYTSPQYLTTQGTGTYHVMPQADPNGLFSGASSEGTWVNCTDPTSKQARVVYIEPRVIVSPFPLSVQ